VSERPFVRTTWAPKGKTPVIASSGSWKKLSLSGVIVTDPQGTQPRLLLRSTAGNVNADEVLRWLKDLKRHIQGGKLLLIWDGLPAHRARSVQAYLATQTQWLRVARFPAYAPEPNPIEYLWGAIKKKDLGNLSAELPGLAAELKKCHRKIHDPGLLRGFLKASGLY
jgi:transposase